MTLNGHSVEYAVQRVGSEYQCFAYPYHGTQLISLHGREDGHIYPVLVDQQVGRAVDVEVTN